MSTGDRNCFACRLMINSLSPMMWIESECYHEKCARAKMEIDKKIENMSIFQVSDSIFNDMCARCNCKIKPEELRYSTLINNLPAIVHEICPSLNDREKELYDFDPIKSGFMEGIINRTIPKFHATGKMELEIKESVSKRVSWKKYFIDLADLVSSRSTCDRRHCGALVVKNNKIISSGYNGSAPGEPHCDDVGHFMVNNSCKRTAHAEVNAISQAKERFESLEGCILYTNTYPCIACFWAIMKSGIKEIYFKGEYSGYVNDQDMEKVAKTFDIKIEKV
jgi:dCMP deaminase